MANRTADTLEAISIDLAIDKLYKPEFETLGVIGAGHGNLAGLSEDDSPQYFPASGVLRPHREYAPVFRIGQVEPVEYLPMFSGILR